MKWLKKVVLKYKKTLTIILVIGIFVSYVNNHLNKMGKEIGIICSIVVVGMDYNLFLQQIAQIENQLGRKIPIIDYPIVDSDNFQEHEFYNMAGFNPDMIPRCTLKVDTKAKIISKETKNI